MKNTKRAKLEAGGWSVGSVKEFLGLSDADAALIDMKLALSRSLRDRRNKQGLSQVQLAERLQSSNREWRRWKPEIRRYPWTSWLVHSYSSEPAPPILHKLFREGRKARAAAQPSAGRSRHSALVPRRAQTEGFLSPRETLTDSAVLTSVMRLYQLLVLFSEVCQRGIAGVPGRFWLHYT